MKINITPKPGGGYLVKDEHGNKIPAADVHITYEGANVGLIVRELAVHGAEVASWSGLEQVPSEALHAELARRGERYDR